MAAAFASPPWADAPFAGEAGAGGAASWQDAEEPVSGGGVTLRLPVAMLEGVEAVSDILSMDTCVVLPRLLRARACTAQR